MVKSVRKPTDTDEESTPIRDFEGLEDEDTGGATDPVEFWKAKQRELVTSVVDYNLSTLSDLIEEKRIDLSPAYQRRFRWDVRRQSLLIESFLMNVPVPPIFLNEDDLGKYSVIDGKQRLNAVYAMLKGRLTLTGLNVFSDINGKSMEDLPSDLQTVLTSVDTSKAAIRGHFKTGHSGAPRPGWF